MPNKYFCYENYFSKKDARVSLKKKKKVIKKDGTEHEITPRRGFNRKGPSCASQKPC
jgi:hypothetical protein